MKDSPGLSLLRIIKNYAGWFFYNRAYFFQFSTKEILMHAINRTEHEMLLEELDSLDQEMIEVDGRVMKPSQCYHLGVDPVHVLFNENCPVELKEKVNTILRRYRYFSV